MTNDCSDNNLKKSNKTCQRDGTAFVFHVVKKTPYITEGTRVVVLGRQKYKLARKNFYITERHWWRRPETDLDPVK